MNLKTGILVLALFSLTQTKAQTNYIILLSGDSLTGKIKLRSDERLDGVKIETPTKKLNFSALQIRKVVIDGNVYNPIKYESSIKLMKLIKEGYLSLYAFQPNGIPSWDGNYLIKMDGNGMDLPNLGFKKIMIKYLAECPEVIKRIETGELGRKDIENIIFQYNFCIETLSKQRFAAAKEIVVSNEKTDAVKNLLFKIEPEEFDSKKDVVSILNDILAKISKNENVPNYLFEALKENLSSVNSHSKDVENLISVLKK